jgi:hypothetical protein
MNACILDTNLVSPHAQTPRCVTRVFNTAARQSIGVAHAVALRYSVPRQAVSRHAVPRHAVPRHGVESRDDHVEDRQLAPAGATRPCRPRWTPMAPGRRSAAARRTTGRDGASTPFNVRVPLLSSSATRGRVAKPHCSEQWHTVSATRPQRLVSPRETAFVPRQVGYDERASGTLRSRDVRSLCFAPPRTGEEKPIRDLTFGRAFLLVRLV